MEDVLYRILSSVSSDDVDNSRIDEGIIVFKRAGAPIVLEVSVNANNKLYQDQITVRFVDSN